MDTAVHSQALTHSYDDRMALDSVDIDIQAGTYVALVGRNGSGKSTFARLVNALLEASGGALYTFGMDTADEKLRIEIRRSAGMVFQNPDNQIVASVVEEDIAFGPENLGVQPEGIRARIAQALRTVGLEGFEDRAPHLLSGGQKQRVAVAGVLAMQPRMVLFDESTSMLDPQGKQAVLQVMDDLHASGITVVHITHSMEEAMRAQRIIVLSQGAVALDCDAHTLFSEHAHELRELGLELPPLMELAQELHALDLDAGDGWDLGDMVDRLCR